MPWSRWKRDGGALDRRGFLALTAAGAAAVAYPGPAHAAGTEDDAYQAAVDRAVAENTNIRRYAVAGREFLHRPRQLLAANADVTRVLAKLRGLGYQVYQSDGFAGVTRLIFGYDVDVPTIVTRLRDRAEWQGQTPPAVQPHHVTVGFGNIMGNPSGPPRPAPQLAPPDVARLSDGAGVTVGVCDTGIWSLAGSYHPVWLGGSYVPEGDDVDAVYLYDDVLAYQGGHGTFVAGVVRQAAPGVRFDPELALDQNGFGDEGALVGALSRLGANVPIVNLSLGCFTQDDVPSLPLANAIAARPAGTVVVAAAGNAGVARPNWPAAFDKVVAVAALNPGPVPASYSGFGSWVDVCAIGDRVSTYVKGDLPLTGFPTRHFDGYAAWSGTSFATAYVSGRIATMMTTAGIDAETARQTLIAQPRWHPSYGVLVP